MILDSRPTSPSTAVWAVKSIPARFVSLECKMNVYHAAGQPPRMRNLALLLVAILALVPILGLSSPAAEDEFTEIENDSTLRGLNPAQQDAIAELDHGIERSEVGARAYGANWVVKAGGSTSDYGMGIAVD